MSRNTIRIMAMVSMMLDHFAAVFLPNDSAVYYILRCIGRMAYPVFLMLFVEGCERSKTKFWKRFAWLLVFAIISEPVFDLAFSGYGTMPSPLWSEIVAGAWSNMSYQNVMWSWLLALIYCSFMNKAASDGCEKNIVFICAAGFGLILGIISELCHVDYGFAHGVSVFICWFVFYLGRAGRAKRAGIAVSVGLTVLYCMSAGIGSLLFFGFYLLGAVAAVLYDPEKPDKFKLPKIVCYGFYPMHLAVYVLIKCLVVAA